MVDFKKLFQEEGMFNIRVTSLGPNFCLLEDLIGGDVECFVEERKYWWEQWFSFVKSWKPQDVDTERFVWLRVMGVPCHAWGERCFTILVKERGLFVKSDESTSLKH